MSRSLKNLIMILLILAVGGAVIITANYAKGNSGDSKNMNGADGSNISDVMPNNSNSNNMEQPPEKPDENIVVDNILKGLDAQVNVLFINIIDLLVSISFIFFFVPVFGIKGFIASIFASEIFNFGLSLKKLLDLEKSW